MRCLPRFVFALVASHSNSIVISEGYSPGPEIQLIISILCINPTQFPTVPPAPWRDANYRPVPVGDERPLAGNGLWAREFANFRSPNHVAEHSEFAGFVEQKATSILPRRRRWSPAPLLNPADLSLRWRVFVEF